MLCALRESSLQRRRTLGSVFCGSWQTRASIVGLCSYHRGSGHQRVASWIWTWRTTLGRTGSLARRYRQTRFGPCQ